LNVFFTVGESNAAKMTFKNFSGGKSPDPQGRGTEAGGQDKAGREGKGREKYNATWSCIPFSPLTKRELHIHMRTAGTG
jgi:hypothetical protein